MKRVYCALLLVGLIVSVGYASHQMPLFFLLPFQTLSFYVFFVGTYFGVRMILHVSNKPYTQPFTPSVTIVIPFYQEDTEVFQQCVASCLLQNSYEIIVVDDGSKALTNYHFALSLTQQHPNLIVLRSEINMGKRHAQSLAFKQAKGDILVTVDSDTILEKNSVANLLKPFRNPKIGAVTGQLSALNKNDNLLTRILNIRYIVAGLLDRGAYSFFGVVNCTSGPNSAYRKELILSKLDEYINQTHKGIKCTFGDDRHLTSIFLQNGYDVFFQKTAKARTIVPTSLKGLATQQLRWNRSFWRENWLTTHWMWNRSKYLTIGTIMDMSLPFLYLGSLVWNIFRGLDSASLFILFPLIICSSVMAYLRNSKALQLVNAKDFLITPVYAWIYIFLLLPITMYALFTTSKTSWGTR
jgi:cellulose synthase/poly-beta-1,6-N-acetylglucosamine synthase-like glycosyltransferase